LGAVEILGSFFEGVVSAWLKIGTIGKRSYLIIRVD
jgi:hypothetical protein